MKPTKEELQKQENEDTKRTLADHEARIANTQTITTLGFIIALITLGGVVIASIAFVTVELHQTNQQTQLLQQINDKLNK